MLRENKLNNSELLSEFYFTGFNYKKDYQNQLLPGFKNVTGIVLNDYSGLVGIKSIDNSSKALGKIGENDLFKLISSHGKTILQIENEAKKCKNLYKNEVQLIDFIVFDNDYEFLLEAKNRKKLFRFNQGNETYFFLNKRQIKSYTFWNKIKPLYFANKEFDKNYWYITAWKNIENYIQRLKAGIGEYKFEKLNFILFPYEVFTILDNVNYDFYNFEPDFYKFMDKFIELNN